MLKITETWDIIGKLTLRYFSVPFRCYKKILRPSCWEQRISLSMCTFPLTSTWYRPVLVHSVLSACFSLLCCSLRWAFVPWTTDSLRRYLLTSLLSQCFGRQVIISHFVLIYSRPRHTQVPASANRHDDKISWLVTSRRIKPHCTEFSQRDYLLATTIPSCYFVLLSPSLSKGKGWPSSVLHCPCATRWIRFSCWLGLSAFNFFAVLEIFAVQWCPPSVYLPCWKVLRLKFELFFALRTQLVRFTRSLLYMYVTLFEIGNRKQRSFLCFVNIVIASYCLLHFVTCILPIDLNELVQILSLSSFTFTETKICTLKMRFVGDFLSWINFLKPTVATASLMVIDEFFVGRNGTVEPNKWMKLSKIRKVGGFF